MSTAQRPAWRSSSSSSKEERDPPRQNHFAALSDDDEDDDGFQQVASKPSKRRTLSDLVAETPAKPNAPRIRYTRERLLSMRPVSQKPAFFTDLEALIQHEKPQDPICWDTLDAESLWAARRNTAEAPRRANSTRTTTTNSSQRWQRGVALPEKAKKQAESSTTDLWDDPNSSETFDFEQMALASAQLEQELHGRSRSSSAASEELAKTTAKVDSNRPLASAGTTIGSGDNVNVFEDFDDEAQEKAAKPAEEEPIIQSAHPTASSRLMAMIGVTKEPEPAPVEAPAPAPNAGWDVNVSVPLNPWNQDLVFQAPALNMQLEQQQQRQQEEQQKKLEAERLEAERLEAERRAVAARMQQQQQTAGVQNKVEQVLIERISTILENSWGRADLLSILTTLHAEDSRVIPLLNTVDALRALLLRHPQRIVIRQDPTMRTEMVNLLVTNAQFQMAEQPPPAVRPNAPWYYSDPSKNIQGPFGDQEMRQWLEAGYFKGDLPISQNPAGPFRPLSQIFTDLSRAFVYEDPEQVRVEQERKEEEKRREELRREEERRREQELAEQKARELAEQQERERQAAAAAAAAAKQQELERQQQAGASNGGGNNESSAQLKMMLGLTAAPTAPVPEPPAPSQPQAPKVEAAAPKPAPKPTAAPAKPAAAAWGGVSKQSSARKSMSEIQQEEARAQATQVGRKSSSSGWASIAASKGGSTGWTGGAAHKNAGTVVPNSKSRTMSLQPSSVVNSSNMATAVRQSQPAQRSQSVSGPTPETAANAFGAKMSPALESWCKEQLTQLTGTSDLTLVSFCMTLTDPDEIRQYLSVYLGGTKPVEAFATEFINRRGISKDEQDEWESTGAKKNRKKKSGAR